MSYDILVCGPLFCDLIFTGLPKMPELGTEIFSEDFTMTVGGSAIVAAGLRKLGADVGFVADLGNDIMSRAVVQMLDDMDIDRTLIREHPHPLPQLTVALSFPQDRAFVTRFERPQSPVDLAALLKVHSAKHLHISSFLAALENPDAPRIAHEAGLTVSMDPGWDEDALRDPRLKAMIAELDVFLPSESELCYIADEPDVEAALAQIGATMTNGQIVLKQGKRGATAYRHNTYRERVGALTVNPVDTTGAGDSFDAGFLFQYAQGADLMLCLQYGAVCGALSTTKVGGATAAPTHEEVKAWLSKLQS
jgi:sugar/nucleoside kinase (ribokinase family)